MSSYLDQVKAEFQAILDGKGKDGKSSLPIYDPADFGYRPIGDEKVMGCLEGVQRVEIRNTGRYFRGDGFWKSVARGLLGQRKAHLLMGSPQRVAEKERHVTATGKMLVTNKALVFEGDTKNDRLTWQQVSEVGLVDEGVLISKRKGKPQFYCFTKFNPKFAAVMYAMCHAWQD